MSKKIEMNKLHEIELEKSFELIQTSQNLRMQVSIFFATVNLGTLSFGVSQGKVIFFLFAALLFWVMIIIDYAIRGLLTHAYYRITLIRKYYLEKDQTFSSHALSRLASEVNRIVNITNKDEQIKALKSLPFKNLYGFWLPIIASLVEIAFGIYLWRVLGWSII